MLDLVSERWHSLAHAYGPASDVPDMLRRLAKDPVHRPDHQAWEDLWSALCHQGTVYTASYAALPHVVDLGVRLPANNQVMYWVFVASIATSVDAAWLPDDLRADFENAIAKARDCIDQAIAAGPATEMDAILLVQAAAATRGWFALARGLEGLTGGEFRPFCVECLREIHVTANDDAFTATLEDPATEQVGSSTSVEPVAADAPTLTEGTQLGTLRALAKRSGHDTLAMQIRRFAGDVRCPGCGHSFSLAEALVSLEESAGGREPGRWRSVDVTELHTVPRDVALELVGRHLGAAGDWLSEIVSYRLDSDWQQDWKIEVGQWLATADRNGYLEPLLQQALGPSKPRDRARGTRDPADPAYRKLIENLTPAMVAHYFIGLGWSFVDFEKEAPGVDIDVELQAPDGTNVLFQVKAPDDFNVESDERVVAAVRKAGRQLPNPATTASIVAVYAKRQISLASDTFVVEPLLLGSTASDEPATLAASDRGLFATEWRHIGAVTLFGHVRGIDSATYACSVLLNPWAEPAARCQRAWFPRARVLELDGDVFQWSPKEPTGATVFRKGTRLVEG